MSLFNKKYNEHASGAILGACIGDALGAKLEFIGRRPGLKDVIDALTMPGGGVWNVAPGQITDDGELTLCLAQALAKTSHYDIELIAYNYAQWVKSHPFDIGGTTMASLGASAKYQGLQVNHANVMKDAAKVHCMHSKANGSLMRATPLGIWGYRLNDRDLATLAFNDGQLSHPNTSCCQAVTCYSLAIATLIKTSGDKQQALTRVEQWLLQQKDNDNENEVLSWFQAAQDNHDYPYYPQIGFVKIAFIHAFRHLIQDTSYIDAMEETLLGGGDTDTNACIIGGLLGAYYGEAALPDMMKKKVLTCATTFGRQRPDFLSTKYIPKWVTQMLKHAPESLFKEEK